MVEKGLGTVRARLAAVHFSKVNSLKNMWNSQNIAKNWGEVNLKKEIPLNDVWESQMFAQKVIGVHFKKEIPLNKICDKTQILIKK